MDPIVPFLRIRPALTALLCVSLAAAAGAQDLGDQEIAPGPPIPVSSVTAGSQGDVDMALAPDDDMIVVWRQSNTELAARRLSADGTLTPAADFMVSADTTETKTRPAVCVDAAGNPVIAWEQLNMDGLQQRDVRVRRFDSAFAPISDEQVASTIGTLSARSPDVACAANGDFVVVWGDSSVRGRRFSADGSPIGTDFQINTEAGLFDSGVGAHIATQDDGDFVVAWAQGSPRAVAARRFSSDGMPLDGTQFDVTTGVNVDSIGLDKDGPSGDFVVSWNDSTDVEVQRYDASGVPMGNTVFADVSFTTPTVTSVAFSGPNGEIVVAWNPDDGPAQAQRLDADMQLTGPEFALGPTGFSPLRFALEGKADGELFTAYSDFVPGQSDDVFARRFVKAFFSDGFESGDTSAWPKEPPLPVGSNRR